MCDSDKIRGIISNELSPINEAVIKLATSTEVLEQSMIKMEKSQEKFYEAMIDQKGMVKDIGHIQKETDTNRKDIDVLYTMTREQSSQSFSRLFVVLMAIFSGVLGAAITTLIKFGG